VCVLQLKVLSEKIRSCKRKIERGRNFYSARKAKKAHMHSGKFHRKKEKYRMQPGNYLKKKKKKKK